MKDRWVFCSHAIVLVLLAVGSQTLAVPSDGLVGWWSFQGNADDVSGNGHDGVAYGATLIQDRFNNPDSAYDFNGDDYIEVPDSEDFTLGSSPFTICAWVKLRSYGADGGYYLMGHSDGPGDTKKWIFWLSNSGIKFIATNPGSDWIDVGSTTFDLDVWYHVAIRRDSSELTAFADGEVIGTASIGTAIPDPSAPFRIGTAEFDRPNRPFDGQIDDVLWYSRALSQDEIAGIWEWEPETISVTVSPESHDFGEVEVGSSATASVTLFNQGDADLTITSDAFSPNISSFSMTSPLTLPATIAPEETLDIEVSFAPVSAGSFSTVLQFGSDDSAEPLGEVQFTGVGISVDSEVSERIAQILAFFDESVEGGTLVGDGPGRSAQNRLDALRNMLEEAARRIEDGFYDEARAQLTDVYKKCDGQSPPPDFVAGDATSELAEMIQELIAALAG